MKEKLIAAVAYWQRDRHIMPAASIWAMGAAGGC